MHNALWILYVHIDGFNIILWYKYPYTRLYTMAAESVVRAGHDNDIQTSLPQAIILQHCTPIEKLRA